MDFFDSIDDHYGVEERGLSSVAEEIIIPAVQFQIADEHYPLSSSDNFGIELYQETVEFITRVVCETVYIHRFFSIKHQCIVYVC